jgi:hypothetical protein
MTSTLGRVPALGHEMRAGLLTPCGARVRFGIGSCQRRWEVPTCLTTSR